MLLSQLLNDSQILSVTYLEIQNDIYCLHHSHNIYPLQLSNIEKWLFNAKEPKVLHLRCEHPDGQFGYVCPIDHFLIPLIKSLLETSLMEYSYLILFPICNDCFDFNLVVGLSVATPYLNYIIIDTCDYLAIRLHETEKFEIFLTRNYLYLRRSTMFGPLGKKIDPQYFWNYFDNVINTQHAIEATIVDNIPDKPQYF